MFEQYNCLFCIFSASAVYSSAHFGQAPYSQTWIDDLGCVGTELDVSQCSHRGWGQEDCSHSEDAGVRCSGVRLDESRTGK